MCPVDPKATISHERRWPTGSWKYRTGDYDKSETGNINIKSSTWSEWLN